MMEGSDADAQPEEQAKLIGQRLRAARKALGLNQEGMAARLGVHPKTYPKWESGERVRSWPRLLSACEAFDLSPNEVLGYDPAGKLDMMVKDALDPKVLGAALEAIAQLAAVKATPDEPTGGDAEFWDAIGSAFVEVIVMTIRNGDVGEARAFLNGVGYLLRR